MASAAAAIRSYADDVRRLADEQPAAGAALLAETIDAALRADTGGDGGFSHGQGMGRATVDVLTRSGSADVIGAGSRGVWAILEHGTRGHEVRAGRGGFLRTPYGPRRAVNVSGVAARRTWTRANERALPLIENETERRFAQIGR
jgi:hypothetical protein